MAQRRGGWRFFPMIHQKRFDVRMAGEDLYEFCAAVSAVANESGALLCIIIHSDE